MQSNQFQNFNQYQINKDHRILIGYAIAQLIITFFILIFLLLNVKIVHAQVFKPEILTVAYESSSQSIEGQILVASVIKQRMKERHQTAKQVVYAKSQFSCWIAPGKPSQVRKLKKSELENAEKAWSLAKPQGWNHYCRYDVKPYWIRYAKGSLRVGDHIFYKL